MFISFELISFKQNMSLPKMRERERERENGRIKRDVNMCIICFACTRRRRKIICACAMFKNHNFYLHISCADLSHIS